MKGLRYGATASLLVLFAINLANYMDRYLVIALQEPIKKEFNATDAEIGLLTSAFVLVYMFASPFCGYVADRVQRRFVISAAVALWSIATAAASRAMSFRQLLALRGAVGIGESGYNAAGQALLTDLFTEEKRNRVMAVFNLAVPVGSALGFGLGGFLLGYLKDWRLCCLIMGAPGLLLALVALFLPQPAPTAHEKHGTLEAYLALVKDKVFMSNTLGFAMQSFVLGGLAQWAAPFLSRNHGMEIHEADMVAGGLVVVSGLVGTAAGAFLGDAFAKRGLIVAYAVVTGLGYLLAAPLLAVGLFLSDRTAALACLFIALVGTFLGMGPSNAIVAARAPAAYRATAFAFVVVLLHLLGDAASPPFIGKVSDFFHAGGLGEGAALRRALYVTPFMLVLGALFMFACAWVARREKPVGAAKPAA